MFADNLDESSKRRILTIIGLILALLLGLPEVT
jgi:hypothetical protein